MTNYHPPVAVIISAYTEARWDDLCAAVASLRAQSAPPRDIVVVVDHNPRLLERVRAALPDVRAVENTEARGLSGARNSGIAATDANIIAFLDDDASAALDWIERLIAPYSDPQVLGVGGAIEPVWTGGRPVWFPDEFLWVVGCTYRGMPATLAPVRNLIGCNMSFRREVFQLVGGFRSGIGRIGALPVGCEETELCIRLRQHQPDATLLYDPQARVRHNVPASRGSWRYFLSRCYAEGLSKAAIAQFVGANDGLSNERTYTFSTLPRGVLRNLAQAIGQRDANKLLAALAIVVGLATTLAGYLQGIGMQRWRRLRKSRSHDLLPTTLPSTHGKGG